MRQSIFLAGLTWLTIAILASAQPGVQIIKLTVSPAKPTAPALKYHLLPELRDLKPGNAAVFYQRAQAIEWWTAAFRQETAKLGDALEQPWDKSFTSKYDWLSSGPVKELDYAARMESCDWQMLERLRRDGPMVLVPDLVAMRELGKINATRARIEIHRGQFDSAVRSLQSGFALSKHVGEAPMLIKYFVGNAVANLTLQQVEEFVQQPGAPNLYWALTDLPSPLIDLRRPLQSERVIFDAMMPEIRLALKEAKVTPIAATVLRKRIESLGSLGIAQNSAASTVTVARCYPAAKEFLVQQGRDTDEVAALPVTQVVLMHQLALCDLWSDELHKLSNLPFPEARVRWKAVQKKFVATMGDPQNPMMLSAMFFPSDISLVSRVRTQRRIEILRCVEAIRAYAAENDNRLPETLEDIRTLPIPHDPMTGKAFTYYLQKGRAILESAPPAGEEANRGNAVRVEIQLMQSSK